MRQICNRGELMDKNGKTALGLLKAAVVLIVAAVLFLKFNTQFLSFTSSVAVKTAARYLPTAISFPEEPQKEKDAFENISLGEQTETTAETESRTQALTEKAVVNGSEDFYYIPEDIRKMISQAKSNEKNDKKDGAISEKTYTNEGMTNKFGIVKVKNTNKTQIDIKKLLDEKPDLSVTKEKPSVLVFHTHTTEAYQVLDRNFYSVGYTARSNDPSKNMVRVGTAICDELERAGYKVIHDENIYDSRYNGAYNRSRQAVAENLKKYPSIQVTLDIHRDAIQTSDGTKIKPTATVGGKKAAQVMIISGCQEEGNGIEDFPDWQYNLIFALKLQEKMEENFPSLTRPIFFCPRRYNMNMTRCSLLIEVGSDSNTLEEAYLSGKCIGKSLADMLKDYTQ